MCYQLIHKHTRPTIAKGSPAPCRFWWQVALDCPSWTRPLLLQTQLQSTTELVVALVTIIIKMLFTIYTTHVSISFFLSCFFFFVKSNNHGKWKKRSWTRRYSAAKVETHRSYPKIIIKMIILSVWGQAYRNFYKFCVWLSWTWWTGILMRKTPISLRERLTLACIGVLWRTRTGRSLAL